MKNTRQRQGKRGGGAAAVFALVISTDSRTSSEILKLNAPESPSQATIDSVQGVPGWLLVLAVVVARIIGAGAASLWWRRRGRASGAP